MHAARAGLHTLLQAKLDPALRQAVLCLTASFCHIASPGWLQVKLADRNAGIRQGQMEGSQNLLTNVDDPIWVD